MDGLNSCEYITIRRKSEAERADNQSDGPQGPQEQESKKQGTRFAIYAEFL
jgi:hypothetical protein